MIITSHREPIKQRSVSSDRVDRVNRIIRILIQQSLVKQRFLPTSPAIEGRNIYLHSRQCRFHSGHVSLHVRVEVQFALCSWQSNSVFMYKPRLKLEEKYIWHALRTPLFDALWNADAKEALLSVFYSV
jgi:hypothetical protein